MMQFHEKKFIIQISRKNRSIIKLFGKIREIPGRAVYFAANGASEERTYVDNIPHG